MSEFLEAVEDAVSKYFGKGFNLCKRQLRHHHPDLAIELEDMGLDQDLLVEEDEGEEEEKEGENADNMEDKADTNPPPS